MACFIIDSNLNTIYSVLTTKQDNLLFDTTHFTTKTTVTLSGNLVNTIFLNPLHTSDIIDLSANYHTTTGMTQLLQSQYYTIGWINNLFYQKSYIDTVLFTKQNNTAFQTGLTTFPYTINDITYYAVSIDASYLDSKLSQYATTVSVNALISGYVSSSYLASNYQNSRVC